MISMYLLVLCVVYFKNVQLEQRVDQFREQMEFQRDSYNSRQDESSDFREILRKKDQEMNAVLDQIEVCVTYIVHNYCQFSSLLVNYVSMYVHEIFSVIVAV